MCCHQRTLCRRRHCRCHCCRHSVRHRRRLALLGGCLTVQLVDLLGGCRAREQVDGEARVLGDDRRVASPSKTGRLSPVFDPRHTDHLDNSHADAESISARGNSPPVPVTPVFDLGRRRDPLPTSSRGRFGPDLGPVVVAQLAREFDTRCTLFEGRTSSRTRLRREPLGAPPTAAVRG
jgi:hypothetical protein